jgi:RNA polymerase sigma-70 factor (ECF subfamily)
LYSSVPAVAREEQVKEGQAPPKHGRAERAAAFTALLDRQLDARYRLALVIVGNRADAEEATHDAAIRAWQRWGSHRDPDQFEASFGRILVDVCQDRMRRRRWVDPAPTLSRGSSGRDATTSSAEQDALRLAISELSPDRRTVVALRYLADLTVDQIAERTGARVATVESRLHDALRALRAAYGAADRTGSGSL